MRWNKIKKDDMKNIVSAYKKGASVRGIAKAFNVDRTVIYYHLGRIGGKNIKKRRINWKNVFKEMEITKTKNRRIKRAYIKRKIEKPTGKNYQEMLKEVKEREPKLYGGY